jgi:hypothetical protein
MDLSWIDPWVGDAGIRRHWSYRVINRYITLCITYKYPKYEFHVPAGTIVREYVLNGAAE